MSLPLELPNLSDTQKSFNAMQTNLLSLNTAVNALQESDKEHEQRLKEINKVVFIGNGELSLREQTRNHERFILEVKYWIRFAVGLIIAQLIAFTGASMVAYFKFLPVLEALAKKP